MGMSTPLSGFQPNGKGLYVPSPGGVVGFQRQGMDQRKKSTGPSWPFSGPNDAAFSYNTPHPVTGITIRWVNSAFAATLAEWDSVAGPLWAAHTPNGAQLNERTGAGSASQPLTNGNANAYVHVTWPTARTAVSWRAHNIPSGWNANQVPGSTRLDAWDGTTWTVIDASGPALPPGADTGTRLIATPVLATQHRLFLGTAGANNAQSLCFFDIKFA